MLIIVTYTFARENPMLTRVSISFAIFYKNTRKRKKTKQRLLFYMGSAITIIGKRHNALQHEGDLQNIKVGFLSAGK